MSRSELEEAWIVQALVREDGLSQSEVAELLGRHQSWVCRRLALLEKLCADVQIGTGGGVDRSGVGAGGRVVPVRGRRAPGPPPELGVPPAGLAREAVRGCPDRNWRRRGSFRRWCGRTGCPSPRSPSSWAATRAGCAAGWPC